VLPEANIPWNAPLYTPLAFSSADRNDYGSHGLSCVGRLKSGETLAQAQAEMDVVSDRIARAHPDSNLGHGALVGALLDKHNRRRPPPINDSVVRGCVSPVDCVCQRRQFAAGSRALATKEIAVRSALGASRGRIIRQFIIDGLLVAVSGGFLGGMLAYASMGFVSRFASQYVRELRKSLSIRQSYV